MVYDDNFDHITPLDCAILSGLIHLKNKDRNLGHLGQEGRPESKLLKNKSSKRK